MRRARLACAFVCCLLPFAQAADGPAHTMRTTHPDIAAKNLAYVIDRARRATQLDPSNVIAHQQLVEHLMLRFQMHGEFDDLAEADDASRLLAERLPAAAQAQLLRASVLRLQHRYADACAVLLTLEDEQSQPVVMLQRQSVAVASGRASSVIHAIRTQAAQNPSYATLTRLAAALGELGDLEAADQMYAAALDAYTDVSPYAVAWVQFQRAGLWREQSPSRAVGLYQAALARVPDYLAANVHLAEVTSELGDRKGAIDRLTEVESASTDPDVHAVLYRMLTEGAGEATAAEERRARADELFQPWLQRFPYAIKHHASEFYETLDIPNDQLAPEACLATGQAAG